MKKQIMILLGAALLTGCTGSGGGQAKMTGQEVHDRFMTMIAEGQYPEAYQFISDRLTDEEILQKDYELIKGIMFAPVRIINRYDGDYTYAYQTDYEYTYNEKGLAVTVKEHHFEQYGNGMEVRTRIEKTYYDEGTVMTEEVYRSYEDQPEYLESASEYLADGTLVHSVTYMEGGQKLSEEQLYDDGSREYIQFTDYNKPAVRTVTDKLGIPELMETYSIPYGYNYENFLRKKEGKNTVITYDTVSSYDGSRTKTREIYDAEGRQTYTRSESPGGTCTMNYSYDSWGNQVMQESDCYSMNEAITRIYHDAEKKQLERVAHRMGGTGADYDEYFEYDEDGKLSRYTVVQSDGTMTSEMLYQDGRIISEYYLNYDGTMMQTSHEYDALGRQVLIKNMYNRTEYYYLDTLED